LRYTALAFDYDGTLAKDGQVPASVVEVLKKVKESGRKLLIVSGRILEDLEKVFPHLDLFDKVVVENGAVVHTPATKVTRLLTEPAPVQLVEELSRVGANPSVGLAIVATWTPHEKPTMEAIQKLGLEHAVIFNKGAVMVLPSGVNKATGLQAALDELGTSPHNVIGVGDAENDHAMMAMCEFSCAVSNALPAVRERADFVTQGDHGHGVIELCDRVLADDLIEFAPARHCLNLGRNKQTQQAVAINTFGPRVLICGSSGSGKSTATTSILEKLAQQKYQLCIIDPEGDYETFEEAVLLGTPTGKASTDEVRQAMSLPHNNVLINLLAVKLEDRPDYFMTMMGRVQESRANTGRPHWLILDEAHHLLPTQFQRFNEVIPNEPPSMLMVTVSPKSMCRDALELVDVFIAMGEDAYDLMNIFADSTGRPRPHLRRELLEQGEALIWFTDSAEPPVVAELNVSISDRTRHKRKYAAGELPEDASFYFRGPENKLNLRAQNLQLFAQMAEGVDDETWTFHLERNDYSQWFAKQIKDDSLAKEAEAIEANKGLTAKESRQAMRELIDRLYTAAA
jgi:hydroxymethylpyrimidine pyrophosphatase-like HAD family hydrolase